MGPLLFLRFVNDLYKGAKYLDLIMFADNMNIFLFCPVATFKNIEIKRENSVKVLDVINDGNQHGKIILKS